MNSFKASLTAGSQLQGTIFNMSFILTIKTGTPFQRASLYKSHVFFKLLFTLSGCFIERGESGDSVEKRRPQTER